MIRKSYPALLTVILAVSLAFLTGCSGEDDMSETADLGLVEQTIRTCTPPNPPQPPAPVQYYWKIGSAGRMNQRPAGYHYLGISVTGVWDPCTGSPPTLEVDWIKGIAVEQGTGNRYTIFETPAGQHGLWTGNAAGQLCWRNGDSTHPPLAWFGHNGNTLVKSPECTAMSVNSGDIAKFTAPNLCNGYVIMHAFMGTHIYIPDAVTDVVAQAKIRITGNLKAIVSTDWFPNATGPAGDKEGAFSDWISSSSCSSDWMIIGNWDPATGQGSAVTDLTSQSPPPAASWVNITQGNVSDGSSFVRDPNVGIALGWSASQTVSIYVEQMNVDWTWKVWRQAAASAPATGVQLISFYSDWPLGQMMRIRVDSGTAKAYTGWFLLTAPPPQKFTVNFSVQGAGLPVSSSMQVFRKNSTVWEPLAVTSTGGSSYQVTPSTFVPGSDVLTIQWLSNGVWKYGCVWYNGGNQLWVNATATGPNGNYYGYIAPTANGCDVGLH